MDNTPKLTQPESLEGATSTNPSVETTGSLESTENSLEQPIDAAGGQAGVPGEAPGPKGRIRRFLRRFNLYLLLFVFVLVIGAAVFLVTFFASRSASKPTVNTQSLSESTLKQLANSDVTVGQPKQVLNVQSNAVFAGKVLIQDSLEVAGPIQVGGSLSIPGITVSGSSVFDQVQVNKTLTVAGDSSFQGQVAIQKNISVLGGGTFGGAISAPQVTTNTLQLNGDLNINRHITAGGPTPGRSNGGALGAGGTSSVSGSDSAGSINVNTGVGAAAGCMVTINFAQRFNATPHVIITPVGQAAGALDYYVTRTTTSFSVCTVSTPPSSANFGFDYFVLD